MLFCFIERRALIGDGFAPVKFGFNPVRFVLYQAGTYRPEAF